MILIPKQKSVHPGVRQAGCKDDGITMARIMESRPMGRGTRLSTSSSRTEQLLWDGKCFLSGANSELTKSAKNIDERKKKM